MRIKINENAASNYHRRCYKGAHPACGMLHRPEWEAMLEQVQGQWLEVETDHLFDNQFNTAPIPGVSDHGMRIMIEDVVEIEGDVREGVMKCYWCGGYDRHNVGKCDKCGKIDTLKPLKALKPATPL